MSMESIAVRAGVSKVSLYRRWSSKTAIVAEVFRVLSEAATSVAAGIGNRRFFIQSDTLTSPPGGGQLTAPVRGCMPGA